MIDRLPGIPGTTLSKPPRWVRTHQTGATERAYRADTEKGTLVAILTRDPVCADGRTLWHLSISHQDRNGKPDRYPTWDELKHAKYQLVPDDVVMILIFPRKTSEYVDVHATTLHLWETDKEIDS